MRLLVHDLSMYLERLQVSGPWFNLFSFNLWVHSLLLLTFPIWGWRIKFSLSTFSGLVLLLSLLVSPGCLFLYITTLSFSLPMFRCPPTSIFHVVITTSSSVFFSTWPSHPSLASLIFSLMFATPALALIS